MAGKKGSGSARTPTEAQIIRALARTRQAVDPRTGSIIFLSGAKSGNKDPFSGAFLAGIEERSELVRRLRLIEPRERLLLFLWYVEGLPVTTIAERLGISRVHCYRLRKRAFEQMTTPDVPDASTPVTKSAV